MQLIRIGREKMCVVLANSGFPNVPHDLSLTTWERARRYSTPTHPQSTLRIVDRSFHDVAIRTFSSAYSRLRFSVCRRKIS